MPELHFSMAAGETGEVGGRAVTPLNITAQVKRPKQRGQTRHSLAGIYLAVQVFLFVQQSSRYAWSDPWEGRVEPGDLPCSGYLPQTAQSRNLHTNFQLFWETKHPDWSKLPSTDMRRASKTHLGNEFPLCSPFQHQPFEDLISVPSNGTALVPRLQVKKHILEAVCVLSWGKEAVWITVNQPLWTASRPACPGCLCLRAQWICDAWYGVNPSPLPTNTEKNKTKNNKIKLKKKIPFQAPACPRELDLCTTSANGADSGAQRWQYCRATCPSKTQLKSSLACTLWDKN